MQEPSLQESVSCLKNVFDQQDDVETFFVNLQEHLESIFSLNESFSLNSFNSVMEILGGKDFSYALYQILISYDENVVEELKLLEDENLISNTKYLICNYGPILEKYYYRAMSPYSIRSNDFGYRNVHGNWEVFFELENHDDKKIMISDNPNNIMLFCRRLLRVLKESSEFCELNEDIKKDLIKQIKKF